jgi:AraC-like DNA-binding protein
MVAGRWRLEDARNLLRFSTHPVAGIAAMLGYRHVCFFSKQFRQRFGVSPSQYRKSVEPALVGQQPMVGESQSMEPTHGGADEVRS